MLWNGVFCNLCFQRRCGLLSSGEGNHVDLPLGWSELAILAQCKGKLQSGEIVI